jgi:hypothetical protein
MASPFYTSVRRNHIVGPAGVGSIVVTRNGITVLMCGLPQWLSAAPGRGADELAKREDRLRLIRGHEIHDVNAERDLGVARFLLPPVVDDEPSYWSTWFLPAVRFPLHEYCHNPTCGSLAAASPENPSVGKCDMCGGKRPSRRQQVPIVRVCPAGHLDEVDFAAMMHPDGGCGARPKLKYRPGSNSSAPEVECLECRAKARVDPWTKVACTGARPWLPGAPPEKCAESMSVSDRTSTAVYYPDVRSFVHVPPGGVLRDVVLRWLEDDVTARALRTVPNGGGLVPLLREAEQFFPGILREDLLAHVNYLENFEPEESDWGAELDALTSGRRTSPHGDGPPMLDAEVLDGARFDPKIVGPSALISRVVAVHRLAETRVLVGFTRVDPPRRGQSGATGFQLMWGESLGHVASHDWLPGTRIFGEGFLLELNAEKVEAWAKAVSLSITSEELQGEELTIEFQVAHTLAHLLMNAASLRCGYPIASLRDRIYALPGRTALLIYTGEGDVMGTLGGLVELAQPGSLELLLEEAYSSARWCGLDPVCMNPVAHVKRDRAGACHQCCLLPETSCGWWNHALDRATLVGRGELRGILQL